MWYAIYAYRGETGWRLRNVFEDVTPDLARSMLLVEDSPGVSLALVEADTREAAESFPAYGAPWRRLDRPSGPSGGAPSSPPGH